MKTALTIAGSDCSGGAGIQADIKTMITNGVYAMSAITALTAQNTTGVTAIMESTPEFLGEQLESIFTDIYPDAVKIGMVSSSSLIKTISDKLKKYDAKNIVVDPVMVATSGAKLISDEAVSTLKEHLFPLATVLTPNIPEAEVLSEMKISNEEEMIKAAEIISEKYGCAVLCKGGHQINDANDLLFKDGTYTWYNGKRINNPNTHGTGCTLSSAIAANLAKGFDLDAYSAGISSESIFSKLKGKYVAVAVTIVGVIAAIVYPMDDITDFLYLIGSVFAPMIAIQIADFFILKKDRASKAVDICNIIVWLAGFVAYRFLMNVDIIVGNTLPDMVFTIILCVIVTKIADKITSKSKKA